MCAVPEMTIDDLGLCVCVFGGGYFWWEGGDVRTCVADCVVGNLTPASPVHITAKSKKHTVHII